MLKSKLLHPEILGILGASGHGSLILIADGNYPFMTHASPAAKRVFLNFMPGKLTATEALEGIVSAVPIEAAEVMMPDSSQEPPIFAEFRKLLPGHELKKHERFHFYDRAKSPDCCLVVATGEQRIYANILLTIGVIPPG